MGVRVLHAADLHLGSPLRAVEDASGSLAEELGRATYEAFRRVIGVALEREVDLVVLAGDLYDREARSVRATDFLIEQFDRLADAGVPCYVVHGNHDPLGEGAESLDLPGNVTVFGAGAVETAHYPDEGAPEVRILGRSYGARHESDARLEGYAPPDRTVPNVGLLHTGLNPDGRRYAPCSPADLASTGIDYWALGHIHAPGAVDGAPAAYAGIPQGRHVGDASVGGCLVAEVEPRHEPDLEFVPTSPIVWRRLAIDVGEATRPDGGALRNLSDVEAVAEERALVLRETDYAGFCDEVDLPVADVDWDVEGVVCRWELTGRGEPSETLDAEATAVLAERLRDRLGGGSPFVWTESVRDRTAAPLPDAETLIAEDEVIGELVALAEELRTDPDARADFRADAGAVWEWVDDPDRETVPADRLALDPDRLDDLLERAARRAIDELATGRREGR
ncbi:exonuclease SbcCD subunit D [Halovivax sp.]|uniref:metallophosphoesterase family protein n=1 Tax=Halovivax sp. TaxID=1935978 RepID=UPI0025BAB023|nr:DNA repair exonuclease [Halovivax sp.]